MITWDERVTMKVATAKPVSVPPTVVTLIGYEPAAVPVLTTNEPVIAPFEIVQLPVPVTGVPEKLHEVSVVWKPTPVTEMVVGDVPEDGVRVMVGGRALNEAAAESLAGVPVAVTWNGPALGNTLPTTNEPLNVPAETVQV